MLNLDNGNRTALTQKDGSDEYEGQVEVGKCGSGLLLAGKIDGQKKELLHYNVSFVLPQCLSLQVLVVDA